MDGMCGEPYLVVPAGLFLLLIALCFTLFMLMGQSAVRIAAGWFESRPTWTESDDAELRKLMRQ